MGVNGACARRGLTANNRDHGHIPRDLVERVEEPFTLAAALEIEEDGAGRRPARRAAIDSVKPMSRLFPRGTIASMPEPSAATRRLAWIGHPPDCATAETGPAGMDAGRPNRYKPVDVTCGALAFGPSSRTPASWAIL